MCSNLSCCKACHDNVLPSHIIYPYIAVVLSWPTLLFKDRPAAGCVRELLPESLLSGSIQAQRQTHAAVCRVLLGQALGRVPPCQAIHCAHSVKRHLANKQCTPIAFGSEYSST